MYQPRQAAKPTRRQAMILLVVIILLTMFAVIGIAFVFYSGAEATSSRIFREAVGIQDVQPDQSPSALLNFFLGQFIYDVDDNQGGAASSVRGHSLARNMYGWDYDQTTAANPNASFNANAFNGIGRLHYTPPTVGQDAYNLVNSMYYSSDGYILDPERVGTRTDPTQVQTNPYVGGNAPYTYPDNNSMFLAAVAADGTVLEQSFFRPNSQFGSLDPTQPNWQTPGVGKHFIMRPRPAESPNFPLPVSPGGDVKNLAGSPGTLVNGQLYNEDSFWMDLGYPVRQAPDGRLYKALFAPLIMDLDSRINLNAVGNIRASTYNKMSKTYAHGSNQGWGRWEMNPSLLLNQTSSNGQLEWFNLLLGNTSPTTVNGRYGPDGQPSSSGGFTASGDTPFFYASVDYDGGDEVNGGLSGQFQLPQAPPQAGSGSFSAFPTFGNGWGNGSLTERTNHPSLYDYFSPQGDDTTLPVSDLQGLLVNMGQQASTTTIGKLSPMNFANATDPASIRRRNLVTPISSDLDRPAIVPWVYDSSAASTQYTLSAGNPYPIGAAISFPTYPPPPSVTPAEFGPDWRAVDAALGRIDLDQYLPDYPAPDSTTHQINVTATTNGVSNLTLLQAAVSARQNMALAIFQRLIYVTGAMNPGTTTVAPSQQQYDALRWLAQLSANIVDYVDADDYMTPFPWASLAGNATFTSSVATLDSIGQGWVFGTELPRVVLNEVYAQVENDPQDKFTGGVATMPYRMNFWAELHNPLNTDPQFGGVPNQNYDEGGAARLQVNNTTANGVYKIVLALAGDTSLYPGGTNANGNVTGTPQASSIPTDAVTNQPVPGLAAFVSDPSYPSPAIDPTIIRPSQPNGAYAASATDGSHTDGFYVVGPVSRNTANNWQTATAFPGTAGTIAPVIENTGMGYTVAVNSAPPLASAVLLQRLANPYLPYQNMANAPNYNPYITVDFMDYVQTQDVRQYTNMGAVAMHTPVPWQTFHSFGKREPYASYNNVKDPLMTPGFAQVVPQNPTTPLQNQPQNTFYTHNGQSNPPQPTDATLTQPFHWPAQPDRQLISTMELLEVSGYKPHELTQMFVHPQTVNGTPQMLPYQNAAPWLDQTARIYRLLEFLECHDRMAGMGVGGRHPGKININTIWDPESFYALCDAQSSNHFTQKDVNTLYQTLMGSRTVTTQQVNGNTYYVPNAGGSGKPDMPFWPMAAPYTSSGDTQYPSGSGLGNTFLRLTTASGGNVVPLLTPSSQSALGTHPYLQNELMAKIANNITTRSNTFAVFVTVGFFQVTDPTTTPPTLGPEIGASQNRQIRHQMFAVVDRTQLSLDQANPSLGGAVTTGTSFTPYSNATTYPQFPPAGTTPVEADVACSATSGTITTNNSAGGNLNSTSGAGQISWLIQPGMSVVVDTGKNQEVVQVELVNNTANANNNVTPPLAAKSFRAKFQRAHATNFPITILGNPGPQPLFDYTSATYAPVVPYYVILQ